MIVKPLGIEVDISNETDLNMSEYIRIVNSSIINSLLTIKDTENNIIGTMTVVFGEAVALRKINSHTISGPGLHAVPISITG